MTAFTSFIHKGRGALDAPIAALTGLAFAFAAFTAPDDLFSGLVGATGLAAILPAAEPPLGLNARLGIAGLGALLVFALAFGLLRWLDRFGRRDEAEEPAEYEPVRLRRRDLHPDAPPPAPLRARELGEPFAPVSNDDEAVPPAEAPMETADARPAMFEPVEEAVADRPSWLPEAPEPTPEIPAGEPTIAELYSRLEAGIARRRRSSLPLKAPGPAVSGPVPDRLQSAIDSLQRLASRQQ